MHHSAFRGAVGFVTLVCVQVVESIWIPISEFGDIKLGTDCRESFCYSLGKAVTVSDTLADVPPHAVSDAEL